MALKPNAATCWIREQVLEDLPSGLTLRFEPLSAGTRLVITARALPGGRRVILFDAEGNPLEIE